MERRTKIVIGVVTGIIILGGAVAVGTVLVRRSAVDQQGPAGQIPSRTGRPGGTTVPSSIGQPSAGDPGTTVQPAPPPAPPGAVALPPSSSSGSEEVPGPPPPPPAPNPIDSDGDSLSNEREAELGTDPNNIDTDGDGITDGDEVNTRKTDPLTPDPLPKR